MQPDVHSGTETLLDHVAAKLEETCITEQTPRRIPNLSAGHAPSTAGHTPSTAGHIHATASHTPDHTHAMEGSRYSGIITAEGRPAPLATSVPETHTEERGQAMFLGYKPAPIHMHSNSSTFDSNDQYTTPPTSPEPNDSPTRRTSTNSAGCDKCFEMKRTVSELEAEIESLVSEKRKLDVTGENTLQMSRQQFDGLRTELYEAEVGKVEIMEYKKRHEEQVVIITELRDRMEQMHLENTQLRNMSCHTGSSERERTLVRELATEKRERERERLEKEKEIINTKTERLNTEREREEKEDWKEYSQQLQEYHWLYGKVKRANSLQCDNDDDFGCAG